MMRDYDQQVSSLVRLLNPKTIAVVGGREAEFTIRQCERFGFSGDVWPVNPNRATISGRPCYARVEDLPTAPDATLIIVPADPSIEIVAALSAMGAGGAMCFASGFSEVAGDGLDRQAQLITAAGAMPVIGPNCHGVLNYMSGAVLWPDQHGGERVEGGVAIVSQSGNMGINFTMQQRGLSLATVISLGNQAIVGVADCVDALLDDERITAIGMHIEGLNDIPAFIQAALKAKDRGVVLVALKTGRTEVSAQITLGHTASLAGADGLYDALFSRLGVARVGTVEEFLETLKFLSAVGPLSGNRLSSMSCSGGEAALIADLVADTDLQFPEMTEDHKFRVQATLNEYVSISNPLDYHTFIWDDEDKLSACFSAMLSGGYDLSMLVIDYPRDDKCDARTWRPATNALIKASQATGQKAAIVSTMAEGTPEQIASELMAAGVVPLHGMDHALSAIGHASRIGKIWALPLAAPVIGPSQKPGPVSQWDEWTSKRWLQDAGVSIPKGGCAKSTEHACEIADGIGFPVALKAVSSELVHKTEIGAVVLNLHDLEAVQAETARLLEIGDSVLVERMVQDAVAELIIGVARDDQFGLYLVIGFGGITVELINDSQIIMLPASRESVQASLNKLKTSALLYGYRGRPEGDVDALINSVLLLAERVLENADVIMEIDINPLMVRPKGKGVVAADAYVRIVSEE